MSLIPQEKNRYQHPVWAEGLDYVQAGYVWATPIYR
jgi:hypothetical protein